MFMEELAERCEKDAEHQVADALPDLISAATSCRLKMALQTHLRETEARPAKVEKVFVRTWGTTAAEGRAPPSGRAAARGNRYHLPEYAKPLRTSTCSSIAAAQKVGYHEIAAYGCLQTWAEFLGNREAADILEEILEEEKTADETLNALTVAGSNEVVAEALGG